MLRFLIFLVGMLSTNRPGGMRTAPLRPDESYGRAAPRYPHRDDGDTWYLPPQPQPPRRPSREPGTVRGRPAPACPAQAQVGGGAGPGRPDLP